MKLISKIFLTAAITIAASFAQEPAAAPADVQAAPADSKAAAAPADVQAAPADSKAATAPADVQAAPADSKAAAAPADVQAAPADSKAAAPAPSSAAFDDFMNQTYTDSTASSSSESADNPESSSSSGEGGLVLYDGQSESATSRPERRQYSRDAPIYRYQGTVGLQSPSRGMVSFEYIVYQELLNVGVHFTDYNSELFQIGASVQYYPMEMRYFYMFLTTDWIHGTYERERDMGKGVFKEYDESLNYMRVVIGLGGEALFMEHFGMYVEVGFEFFAGEGDYFLHMNKKYGYLTNDTFKLPYGAGLLFPF